MAKIKRKSSSSASNLLSVENAISWLGKLLFDPKVTWITGALLWVMEIALNIFIIEDEFAIIKRLASNKGILNTK